MAYTISILATVAIFTGIIYILIQSLYNPLIHIFSGGLMLGAAFMATDYVTSPMTKKGYDYLRMRYRIYYSRNKTVGAYPRSVSFAHC